jgi:hypothetical protein
VTFAGYQPNVESYLEALIFCLLSVSEGISNALLEAVFWIALPASSVGGTRGPWDGKYGVLLPAMI